MPSFARLAPALALLAGCSTVTHDKINTLPASTPQISPALAVPATPYKGLKRKVAIARFSNETHAGASFLLDSKQDRIGKQASDILAARLAETQKFILLERTDLDKIISEQKLAKLESQQIGADYLIVGSVSEFGRNAVSETGVFSRNKIQQARAKVNIRLIDVSSGQVLYSEEGAGEAQSEANTVFGVGASAGYDSTLDDRALSAAISKLVSNVAERLLDKPWQAYLLGEQEGLYLMTGGKAQGIKNGDEFVVVQRGRKVTNPQTGLSIELPGKEVATLKVTSFVGEGDSEIAICSVTTGKIAVNDLATLVVREKK